MNLYFFPTIPRGGSSNPYSFNYKKAISSYYELADDSKVPSALNYPLLHFAFKSDIFVLNWIESVIHSDKGLLKFLLVIFSLNIIRIRKKTVVWMLHNIQPHEGSNIFTQYIQKYLFMHATLIVCHSKEAYNYAKAKTICDVFFSHHPVACPLVNPFAGDISACDVLIWGAILPYKGIYEFISQTDLSHNYNIAIIGSCKDSELESKILSCCNDHIIYENRRIGFDELKARIEKSKYVLFPYIGKSVSSSGALIDTICLGGVPVGPHIGAFSDLSEEGVCLTYHNQDELKKILKAENMSIDDKKRNKFIYENSWDMFAKNLSVAIESVREKRLL